MATKISKQEASKTIKYKPSNQPSKKPSQKSNSPAERPYIYTLEVFLLFFLHGGLSNATFLFFIFYCYIQITNYYDPEGDAFQTETEVSHCIAFCF